MRAMRKIVFERDGIRVNCVCPGVTDTPMTVGIVEKFRDAGLFTQSAESVAKIVLGFQCADKVNGKAVYVEGGDGWEFEDSFYRLQPQWLGEEPTRRMRTNSEAVQKVSSLIFHLVDIANKGKGGVDKMRTLNIDLCHSQNSGPILTLDSRPFSKDLLHSRRYLLKFHIRT